MNSISSGVVNGAYHANGAACSHAEREPAEAITARLHDTLTLALHEHRHGPSRQARDRLVHEEQTALAIEAAGDAERLRQTRFLAVLAHELRTPLAPIRTAAALLERLPVGDPGLRRVQLIIERQSHHLARLIEDLLDVSRMRTGKLRLVREPMTMADFLDGAVDSCRAAIDQRQQSLVIHLPSSPPVLHGDSVRLTQVFSNLLDNASKYTPLGGAIGLTATVEAAALVITVSDSGIGIADDSLDSVFEPFVQEERALGVNGAGLGIGLAVVRELVDAHGGSVVAHSAGVGFGSRFVVVLPLAAG